jgi:hypothetical protein
MRGESQAFRRGDGVGTATGRNFLSSPRHAR